VEDGGDPDGAGLIFEPSEEQRGEEDGEAVWRGYGEEVTQGEDSACDQDGGAYVASPEDEFAAEEVLQPVLQVASVEELFWKGDEDELSDDEPEQPGDASGCLIRQRGVVGAAQGNGSLAFDAYGVAGCQQ